MTKVKIKINLKLKSGKRFGSFDLKLASLAWEHLWTVSQANQVMDCYEFDIRVLCYQCYVTSYVTSLQSSGQASFHQWQHKGTKNWTLLFCPPLCLKDSNKFEGNHVLWIWKLMNNMAKPFFARYIHAMFLRVNWQYQRRPTQSGTVQQFVEQNPKDVIQLPKKWYIQWRNNRPRRPR